MVWGLQGVPLAALMPAWTFVGLSEGLLFWQGQGFGGRWGKIMRTDALMGLLGPRVPVVYSSSVELRDLRQHVHLRSINPAQHALI